jgi:hypothetical protein
MVATALAAEPTTLLSLACDNQLTANFSARPSATSFRWKITQGVTYEISQKI